MKLKKIASLMLAGIMAVSMLAACGEGKKDDSSSSSSEVPTVTGAAAAINAELDSNKNKISFENDRVIESYLTDYYANNPIKSVYADGTATTITDGKQPVSSNLVADIVTLTNAKYGNIAGNNNATGWEDNLVLNSHNTKKVTNVEVYVLNAEKLTEAGALKLVGQYLDDLALPSEGVGVAVEKNYSYSGTVAAVEAKTAGETASVWVIAVTITQTPADK